MGGMIPIPNGELVKPERRGTEALIGWMNRVVAGIVESVTSVLPLHLTDANTVEQYNGTNPQAWRIYNTRTSDVDYERASIAWVGNQVTFTTEAAGAGVVRNMNVQTGTGNFGVGTGTPSSKLTVFSTGAAILAIGAGETRIFAQNSITGAVAQLGSAGAGQVPNVGTFTNHPFIFRTNDADRGRIDATGNWIFGGNTADASALVQVDSTTKGFLPPRQTTAQRTAIPTPAGGLTLYDSERQRVMYAELGEWLEAPRVRFSQTASVTVAGTVAETTLLGAGVGSLTLPANALIVGRTVRFRLMGNISGLAAVNIRFRAKIGGVTIADTLANSSALTLATVRAFTLECELTCRTVGGAGTAVGQILGTSDGNQMSVGSKSTATVVVDTTIANALNFTVEWGTASASNSITVTNVSIETIN